jgi:hypothetical protein
VRHYLIKILRHEIENLGESQLEIVETAVASPDEVSGPTKQPPPSTPRKQRVSLPDGQHDAPRALGSIAGEQLLESRIEFLAALGKPPPFDGQPGFQSFTFRDALRQRFSPVVRLFPGPGGILKRHWRYLL